MLKNIGVFESYEDGTIKSVFIDSENRVIEISLLKNKEYDVLCVPTHHYCSLGCRMCHLTKEGAKRCMSQIESKDLMEAIYKTMIIDGEKITNKNKLLISFMGVGDPLLNFDLIKETFFNEEALKKLGYLDINYALATMMPIDNMEYITKEVNEFNIPLKIHYSMHSPKEEIRKSLIPGSKVNIEDALEKLKNYREVIQNNSIIMDSYKKFHHTLDPTEIHYTLIRDVNDSKFELALMINFLNCFEIPLKFIKFNPKDELEYSSNQEYWVQTIKEVLPNMRIKEYDPPGHDVGASCGEFTKHYYLSEMESMEDYQEFIAWYNKHAVKDPHRLIKK